MKMFFYRGAEPNFGDELNLWLWPKMLGDVFDDNDEQIFLGIGSIILNDLPTKSRKIVFGAGYGGYTAPPNVHDGTWDIIFVRGPQTAEVLDLNESAALTDAAILVRTQPLPEPISRQRVSFMPHFESISRGNWKAVCEEANIHFIDPRSDVTTVLGQIRGTELLLTEAMHGAIVADSLRVRWIPLLPISSRHHFKWSDWTRSVGLTYNPVQIVPSTMEEAWVALLGRSSTGRFGWALSEGKLRHLPNSILKTLAANRLRSIALGCSYLSDDEAIERLTDCMLKKVELLKERYFE